MEIASFPTWRISSPAPRSRYPPSGTISWGSIRRMRRRGDWRIGPPPRTSSSPAPSRTSRRSARSSSSNASPA
eukprot:12862769-Prorocentrum_lima.AAC.1